MQTDVTQEMLSKLPKWAQHHIHELEHQREAAIQFMDKTLDSETPSSFYIDKFLSIGESVGPTKRRRYIQGHKMTIEHLGVTLHILLRAQGIDLAWSRESAHQSYHSLGVALVPTATQQASIIPVRDDFPEKD